MQAGLSHQGQKPYGLQGDGLAAGVGAGDNQGIVAVSQGYVDGNHGVLFEQGMTSLSDIDFPLLIELRAGSVHIPGQGSPGKNVVQLRQDRKIGFELLGVRRQLIA